MRCHNGDTSGAALSMEVVHHGVPVRPHSVKSGQVRCHTPVFAVLRTPEATPHSIHSMRGAASDKVCTATLQGGGGVDTRSCCVLLLFSSGATGCAPVSRACQWC